MEEAQLLSSSHWFYIQNWLDKQRISGSFHIFQCKFGLTMHSDECACICDALHIFGDTHVQTLVILLHPIDD